MYKQKANGRTQNHQTAERANLAEKGFSRHLPRRWSPKYCHFLFCSPNRKCQHFPAIYWLIRTVFTGHGFLGMSKTTVKSKMLALPVSLAFFACQTRSVSILLPFIDWAMPFSQEGGVWEYRTQWWSSKWLHFLFCLPNRKCQHFPAWNRLICAVFTF